jgi:hypothetical protein
MHHESPTISSLAVLHRAAENPHCPVSSSNYLRRDGAFSGLEVVMVKDRWGAERLADMIARKDQRAWRGSSSSQRSRLRLGADGCFGAFRLDRPSKAS